MDIGTYIRDVINKTQGKDPTIDYTDTIEQINAITDKNLLPQKPEISKGSEYERLDYTPPTDEQIEKSAGAVLADVWVDGVSMPVVDCLGDEFLNYVKDGMKITIKENGLVEVEV